MYNSAMVPKSVAPASNRANTAMDALSRLTTPDGAICASGGPLYSEAIFGRDSLEVAEDISGIDPQRALQILLSVARLQGVRQASPGPRSSEEEPGRIHHEARLLSAASAPESPASAAIRKELSAIWGGTDEGFVYYGSADATPLFVRVVGNLVNSLGAGILATPVTRRDGKTVPLRQCALDAALWVERRINATPMGLLTYRRNNPQGIQNQVWRDSWEAYLLPPGKMVPANCHVATVEIQALAVDALRIAADYCTDSDVRAGELKTTANNIRMRTIRHFAMPSTKYMCAAVYLDPDGVCQQVKMISSAAATLLDSTFFEGPNPELFGKWRDAIARTILSPSFLCEAGVRTLAKEHLAMLPYTPYHGSGTSWPKETMDICRGLTRQGFPQAAANLASLLEEAIRASSGFPEFFYVTPDGAVAHSLRQQQRRDGKDTTRKDGVILGTNLPEDPAAWTASAAAALAAGSLVTTVTQRNSLDHTLAAKVASIRKACATHDSPAVMDIDTKRGQRLARKAMRTANGFVPVDYLQQP